MGRCNECFNTDKQHSCSNCVHNPAFPKLYNNFVSYPAVCQYGYYGCVSDPGYIWRYNPEWFVEIYGNVDYRDCVCEGCVDGSLYDDEDK